MSVMKMLFGAKAATTARKVTKAARTVAKAAPAPASSGSIPLAGTGDFDFEVVGESFYQDALAAICGEKCEDGHDKACTALLQPEPTNPYDKNAVAVIVNGNKVAHLSREDAKDFLVDMRRLGAQAATCRARITGGWMRRRANGRVDEGDFGVELDLDWPLRRA